MTQLAAGDRAPEFALPDQNGRTVTLGDLCASTDKGVIVYFYPKACTPGCTKEACDFTLLSDVDHAVMEAWGVWGEKKNYGRVYTGVIRSTVVVAPDGSVALAQYNVRATGHVKRLRAALGVD